MQIYDKNEQQDRILKSQLFGNMKPNLGWTPNPQEFQFLNSGSINHLFDQFGNHSHHCKCMKLKVQELVQKQ